MNKPVYPTTPYGPPLQRPPAERHPQVTHHSTGPPLQQPIRAAQFEYVETHHESRQILPSIPTTNLTLLTKEKTPVDENLSEEEEEEEEEIGALQCDGCNVGGDKIPWGVDGGMARVGSLAFTNNVTITSGATADDTTLHLVGASVSTGFTW